MTRAGEPVVRLGPLRIQQVRGEPYVVGGRRLTPIVRIVSLGKAQATVGAERISGRAVGSFWVKPLAMAIDTPDGEKRVPIEDGTASALRAQLIVVMVLTVILAIVRHMARR